VARLTARTPAVSSAGGSSTAPATVQKSSPGNVSEILRAALPAIAAGYLLLSLGLALRLWRSWRATQRIARAARPAPVPLEALASELGAAGMLRVSDAIAAPMTFGVTDPVIVLPDSFARGARPDAVRGVLVHELAHVRRRDCALNLLCELLALPLAFHPLVRTLRRRIAGARESACDEAAAAVVDPGAYAATLLDVATAAARRPRLAGAVGVLDGDSLEDRMKRVLDDRARLRGRRALLLFALSVLALGLVGRAAASAALQVGGKPGPDDMIGVWEAVMPTGDRAGEPAAGLEIILTPSGPAIDMVMYRYKHGSKEAPQIERPPVVSHRVENGVLHFRTRAQVPMKSGGPLETLEADWSFSVVGKDQGELRVTVPKLAAERATGKDVPPSPPPLAMKRVKR
jgi:beta-lactamase regulating signal transducer with metallopeptidase domain